jgi:hypothetical protein
MSTNLRFNFMSVILIAKFTILISAVAKNGSFAFVEGSACAVGGKIKNIGQAFTLSS